MGIRLANGATIAIAATYGTEFTISAITNANPAVITFSGSPALDTGDIIQIESGWGQLTNRVVRLIVTSGTTAQLEGINTTDTDDYPAGTGAGTAREVLTWTQITQVRTPSTSGGDQQYVDTTTLENADNPTQIPTRSTPQSLSLEVYDDPDLAWYATVRAAAGVETGLRVVFRGNSRLLASAHWTLQETPNMAIDQPLTVRLNISYAAQPTRYST